MKKIKLHPWLSTAVVGLALACSITVALAVPLDVQIKPSCIQTNGDASATEIGNWGTYWISVGSEASFTKTYDAEMRSAANIPASVFFVCDWTGAQPTDINLGATLPNGGGTWLGDPSIQVIDATLYQYLMMDIYFTNVVGLTSWPEIGLMTPGYGRVALIHNVPIASTPGWQHLLIPIDATIANLNQIAGVYLYRWATGPEATHAEFWIDNVQLIAKVVATPPPTLVAPVKVEATGLQMTTSTADGQGTRQGIYLKNAFTWFGSADPVTYSITITNYPGANYPNFQTHLFLVGNDKAPSNDSAVDWNAANLVFFQVQNLANGNAQATFMYKTNVPPSNTNDRWDGQVFGSNTLAVIQNPGTILGKWSLSFVNDTNVTITTPGGTSTNFVFPPDSAAYFNTGYPVFGTQPNSQNNVGQPAIFSDVKITQGATVVAEGNFSSGALDSTMWELAAGDTAAVFVIPPDSKYWLNWTLPATGFDLLTAPTLGNPTAWVQLTSNPNIASPVAIHTWGGLSRALVPTADLANPDQGYFALIKRVFVKLQVLMPGETAAPGTATGKTGTPAAQQAGVPFDVTVNACDDTWHVVNSTDTITITSSDVSGGLPLDAALVSGTGIFSVYFGSQGNYTVTASDTTDPTKTANTGTSTHVNP